MDVSLPGNPFKPAMGRYSLLPSASHWASVSEEAENVTPVVEGTFHFALFHCYYMLHVSSRVTSFQSLFPFSCSKALFTKLTLSREYSLSAVVAQLNG